MPAMSLKGNMKMKPTILNTAPIVNPTIANGSNKIQTNSNKKNRPIANGQLKANKMQNNKIAINSFIKTFFVFI